MTSNVSNQGFIEKLESILREKNVFTEQLIKIEVKTGVRRLYIVMGSEYFIILYYAKVVLNCKVIFKIISSI